MIIRLRIKKLRHIKVDVVEITLQCEDFDAMLLERSPNLLIDHLNAHYGMQIERITNDKKKGGCNGTI